MKTIRYKLTNQDMITHNTCQWTLNEWKETSGKKKLCSNGWLHCYSNPLLAILLNPIHANIDNPRLFEVEVEGNNLTDNGLKEGWTRMRLVKELDVPKITIKQRAAFCILCALEVNKNENFILWANNWLSGKDRSKESAYAAYYAAAYADADASAARSYSAAAAAAAADSAHSAADYFLDFSKIIKKAMKVK